MNALERVNLLPLMQQSIGRADMKIGLIDGPVAIDHPDLRESNVHEVSGRECGACRRPASAACMHGTLVLGILSARRGSVAPAICPGCSLLIRPIFSETFSAARDMPTASSEELAAAIVDTVHAGAHVINLSAALDQPFTRTDCALVQALDFAAARSVIVVVAAGNQGTLASSVITRHPWVIPVAGCNLSGEPLVESNFGRSIGRRGLRAPGQNITSLGSDGKSRTFGGTSAAAPFVTGAIALLWSLFPSASAVEVKTALNDVAQGHRHTVVPPLLNATAAYRAMAAACSSRYAS